MLEREQIDYLLTSAYNAAIRAGNRIVEIYNSDDQGVNLKSDNTPSTRADREAHDVIKHYLGQTRIPILSEEGRNLLFEERGTWDLFWMVDPLDGTREFIRQESHEFTVNIALMVENEPFLGIIYAPCLDKIYFSDMDRGAFVKENVIPDSEASFSISEIYAGTKQLPLATKKNSPLRVTFSRLDTSPDTRRFLELMREKVGEVKAMPVGSSLKFGLIAEGTADLYIRTTVSYEWDTAAGQAIVTAAGGKAFDIVEQSTLKYNKSDLENPYFICKSRFIPDIVPEFAPKY